MAIEIRPLEQFTIERLIPLHIGGVDVSYTNAAFLMTVAVVLVTALIMLGTRKRALVPGRNYLMKLATASANSFRSCSPSSCSSCSPISWG